MAEALASKTVARDTIRVCFFSPDFNNTRAKKGLVFFQSAPNGKGLVLFVVGSQRQVAADAEYVKRTRKQSISADLG